MRPFMSMSEAIIKQLKRIMFIVDRFSLVSIELYKNQCLDKQTCADISLSRSKPIFLLTLNFIKFLVLLIIMARLRTCLLQSLMIEDKWEEC